MGHIVHGGQGGWPWCHPRPQLLCRQNDGDVLSEDPTLELKEKYSFKILRFYSHFNSNNVIVIVVIVNKGLHSTTTLRCIAPPNRADRLKRVYFLTTPLSLLRHSQIFCEQFSKETKYFYIEKNSLTHEVLLKIQSQCPQQIEWFIQSWNK